MYKPRYMPIENKWYKSNIQEHSVNDNRNPIGNNNSSTMQHCAYCIL